MDLEELEKKVISLGGVLISKELQRNYLIDSNLKPIKSYLDAYLRIRETKDLINGTVTNTLTLKKNIENDKLRENIELNVNIDNKENLIEIFKSLEFDNISLGYKERRSYRFMEARLDMDIWDKEMYPYPYMEIEVKNSEDLDKVIEALEIPKENISTDSIMELKSKLKIK